MAQSMKKTLVIKTFEILQNNGIESVKIRRVATEAGCTSTVIYKHFKDLDHLITFASIRLLEDYIRDFRQVMNEPASILDRNIWLWERFSSYAFRNIPLFELLFWGRYRDKVGDMFFEYQQMFLDEMPDFDALSASVLFNGSLQDREYIMLRRAAAAGCIPPELAADLSELIACLFHGVLMEYRDSYKQPGQAQKGADQFMRLYTGVMHRARLN